jgi:hypothetical protein
MMGAFLFVEARRLFVGVGKAALEDRDPTDDYDQGTASKPREEHDFEHVEE